MCKRYDTIKFNIHNPSWFKYWVVILHRAHLPFQGGQWVRSGWAEVVPTQIGPMWEYPNLSQSDQTLDWRSKISMSMNFESPKVKGLGWCDGAFSPCTALFHVNEIFRSPEWAPKLVCSSVGVNSVHWSFSYILLLIPTHIYTRTRTYIWICVHIY